MSNTIKPVYYELNGNPVTGLSVTATCKNITNGEVLFTNQACTADGDIDGMYTTTVYGGAGSEFIITFDAGTDSVDNRKQAYTFVIPEPQRAGGGPRIVGQGITEKDLDKIAKKVIESIEFPEQEDLKPFIEQTVDSILKEGVNSLSNEISSIESTEDTIQELKGVVGTLESQIEQVSQKQDKATQDLSEKIESVGKMEDIGVKLSKEQGDLIKAFKNAGEKSENIEKALVKFMDQVTSNVVEDITDFFTALEIKKQEASKELATTTLKDFRQFKQNN